MILLADSAILVSLFKPLLLAGLLIGWAVVAGRFDKDMDYFFLKRKLWNGVIFATGMTGMALALWIKIFWIGFPIGLLIMIGGIAAYWFYRNKEVPEKQRWQMGLSMLHQRLDERKNVSAQSKAILKLIGPEGGELEVPYGEDPFAIAHQRLQDILAFALPRQAEYLTIQISATEGKCVATIDGAKHAMEPLTSGDATQLLEYLKGSSAMNLVEKRKKQEARLKIVSPTLGSHIIDIATAGSTTGATLRLEFDKDKRLTLDFDSLGLLESQKQRLLDLLQGEQKRIVLVSVPSKQGLSTTLSSLLGQHDPYTQQLITLEDEIPVRLEGVEHTLVDPKSSIEKVSDDMARMLRSDPGVLLLSKLYDPKLAGQLGTASEDMRVYIGMRHRDTFSALKSWCKAVGDLKLAGESTTAVISQQLIRKLCVTCRVPMKPTSSALAKLNLSPDKVIYKQSGKVMVKDQEMLCPDCHGVGYRGRTGVFEVMILDDQARDFIKAGKLDLLRKHLRRQKMLWMQEAALALVVEGKTSIAEISRVMENPAKPKSKSKPKGA